MWRFLRNRRLTLRLRYFQGTHILGASRGGPCDSEASCFVTQRLKSHAFTPQTKVTKNFCYHQMRSLRSMPQKCVGGRGSAPDSTKLSPRLLARFQAEMLRPRGQSGLGLGLGLKALASAWALASNIWPRPGLGLQQKNQQPRINRRTNMFAL